MIQAEGDRAKMFNRRTAMLAGGGSVLVGSLIARMYYLQIVEADRYRTLADENRINLRLLPPPRGRILDRFGEPLAVNKQNFRVLIVREDTRDVDATLRALAEILPLTERDFQRVHGEMRRKRDFVPVTVRENLSWQEMARIQVNAPDLPGVMIDEGLGRYYPKAEMGAHVLGYVAAVSEDDLTGDPLLQLPGFRIGKAGLERRYDLALRGTSGNSRVEVNALGRVIKELERNEGTPGADLNLTIDYRLQSFAFNALGEHSAACVVMEVHTGEILAMCSTPSFDPNAFNRGLTPDEWRGLSGHIKHPLVNKAIRGQYAPGSTFKMVVALAALEAGAIEPHQTVWCPGHMTLGGHRFHCWKREGHGHMNLLEGIKQSCDVYFYEIAKRTGVDRIADMARRFGLGSTMDLDLPGERAGVVPSRAWKQEAIGDQWHQGETLIAGIGQGYVLTTPLQLAVMTARMANGQKAVTPSLTRQTLDSGGRLVPRPAPDFAPLKVNPTHLHLIRHAMYEVVNGERGTAGRSRFDIGGARMSGKTGTAQVRRITMSERESGVLKNEELEWRQRDHSLFVAYAPHDEPRYAIAVVVEHGGSGSKVAAPIASEILAETLRLDPAASGLASVAPASGPISGGDVAEVAGG